MGSTDKFEGLSVTFANGVAKIETISKFLLFLRVLP